MEKRHKEKRQNLEAIENLKKNIREKGDVSEKEFSNIMKHNANSAMDPAKGQKTKPKDGSVLDQVKRAVIPKAKRGESGRLGKGRFNAKFSEDKAELKSKNKNKAEKKDKFAKKDFKKPGGSNFKSDFKKDNKFNKAKKVGGGFKNRR